MKLTSNEALNILKKLKGKTNNDNWIKHCICVGNTAGIIAVALNLDEDYSKTLGYIHDIGKQFNYVSDGVYPHAIKGYNYLKNLGYDEEFAGICIKHSFLNNDINCLANSTDETDKNNVNYEFFKEYIKNDYTIYEKIINLCDLMCTTKRMTIDQRLNDIISRLGTHANTNYHINETKKLKKYFDDKLGYDLYDLFPESKNN